MKRFDDPAQVISVSVGQAFAIDLGGNPTTGYTWSAKIDGRYLELTSKGFRTGTKGVGAGGWESFELKALKAGKTEITFEYRRPWGGEPRDSKRFQVEIA
jgi:predicted secreted protein